MVHVDADGQSMKIFNGLGAVDDMLDPTDESGDTSVNSVIVGTPTTFAPAHHPSQKPAT